MKPLLPLLFCLLAGPLSAIDIKLTVHGGETARSQAIVTFTAPKEWQGEHAISAKEGQVLSRLQVGATGRAVLIVPQIGAGENLVFTNQPSAPALPPPGITVEKAGTVLRFISHADGKTQPLFDYQMQPGAVPEGVSKVFEHGAHLHPVYTPSGRLLTGNHPSDHRWHRGIWMAWTKTEFGDSHPDFWNQGKGEGKDKSGDNILAEVRFEKLLKSWGGSVEGGFISQHQFLDHSQGAARPVLNETWEVTAYATTHADQPVFIVDLTSTQTCATDTALKLPEYHYGGLGVRGHEQWNPVDAVTMLTSNGDDRKKGDSTKGKWVQMGGEVDGQPAGIAILIHPENFRFPQPLRLNPKNPQLCIAPSQDGDWSIEPGKPYISKYRFVLSDGLAKAPEIESAWGAYTHPLKVTLD